MGQRSIFNPDYERSKVNFFGKINNFFNFTLAHLKNISRNDLKLVPACFPLNAEQNEVSLPLMDGIFVGQSIPEGNSVTLIGKIARGQTGSMAMIDIG